MAGTTASAAASSSSQSSAPSAPKILLAKPGLVSSGPVAGKFGRSGGVGSGPEDDAASLRSRLPQLGSLNLLSDSWEFHIDRILPFLTDNTEFTVIGVIGPTGVGKSTIMNELYGFDGSSSGMLPPFAIQSDETRVTARHCSVGIEPRISTERIILLDTQPVFSPSVLAEMMRPDGSPTISVLSGQTLSAELAHELMGIQVDLLKHGIPDPSSLSFSHLQSLTSGPEKENKDKYQEAGDEYLALPVFVHSKLPDEDLNPHNSVYTRKALVQYFSSSLFMQKKSGIMDKEHMVSSKSSVTVVDDLKSSLDLFFLPLKNKDDSSRVQYESYDSAMWKLRDQVLSMGYPSFSRTVSERDWLKNSAKIWDLVKSSPIIAEYSRTLQSSGLFRR